MASLLKQPGGRKAIQITSGGKRHTIRLGKITLDQARQVKVWIERLARAGASGIEDAEAMKWTTSIDASLRKRMEAAGIIRQAAERHTLGELVEQFYASPRKSGTVTTFKQTTDDLLSQWGSGRDVRAIRILDAEKWRNTLSNRGYAAATISKRIKTARQLFNAAKRWGWIEKNPFDEMKAGSQENAGRLHFIGEATAHQVLAACPDDRWRLIFALCRWGGLRCPSELAALRWCGVDWERNRLTVYSPKTADQNKPLRIIPIFPEIHAHLLKAFEAAEAGESKILPGLGTATNLRTMMGRILERAGINPWPKLFQNLRSTRETELAEQFPIQVVCAWIGNSPEVARRHYLQVREEHFEKALQKAVRPTGKTGENEGKHEMGKTQKTPVKVEVSRHFGKPGDDPKGIRTPVAAVKGRCPRPLDDGAGRSTICRCLPARQSSIIKFAP